MKLSGAEIIIKLLERQGIDTVAGIPGGANLPLYDALFKSPIRHILARHEQGAGFIAHGMARSTGRPAVCFATSGPGATNLITAIADARLDSVPLIAITGQVPTSMLGSDAFQEVDIYNMTIPITKHNFLVRGAAELLSVIPEAFEIAISGRPGPVLIDVPKDVQTQEIDIYGWPEVAEGEVPPPPDMDAIAKAAAMINAAKRPVLYAGGGVTNSASHATLRALAEKNSIPVALTLMGLGCFPPDHPLYLGMLGMHAAPYTNLLLDEADLLIAVGARFDDRAVGRVQEFCPEAAIVHIDIDRAELDKIKKSHVSMACDAGEALAALLPPVGRDERPDWLTRLSRLREEHPFPSPAAVDALHPLSIIRTLAACAPADAIITTDVGQHQMWVAQGYPFNRPRTLLTSGGLGTMGFGLPAAIGASLANPGRRVICISGDGSIQMNIQELATLSELGLPVTLIVLNNGHLGLVRQQQELFYGSNFIASRFGIRLDFAAIAGEFGIRGSSMRPTDRPAEIIAAAVSEDGPCVIDIAVDAERNVFPIVPPGAANRDMIGGESYGKYRN
jgi:acetolactate synthase-1/2/3 large subunit